MDKKHVKEKSQRYRFWRMLLIVVLSGLLGFGVGYFDLENSIRIDPLALVQMIQGGVLVVEAIFFLLVVYYLWRSRRFSLAKQEEMDEDRAGDLEVGAQKAYSLATIWSNLQILPFLIGTLLYLREIKEVTATLYTNINFILLFLFVLLSNVLIRSHFKVLHGKALPRFAMGKEAREWVIEQMDEAERQVNYEENFELMFRLVNLVFPSIFIILIVGSVITRLDLLPTAVVLSIVYLYIIISQYRITKRYYK